MKNLEEIILGIKTQIRAKIPNCICTYKGVKRKVDSFVSFGPNGFNIIEKFNLAEVPVTGPVNINIKFVLLARIDIDGNIKSQSYLGGKYGPLTIRYENSEYYIDYNDGNISDLRD